MNVTVSHALWIPLNINTSAAPATTNSATAGRHTRIMAPASSIAYATNGSAAYQNQSSASGKYPVCLRACEMTLLEYATPAAPQIPKHTPTCETACQGALPIAQISRATQKCTIV